MVSSICLTHPHWPHNHHQMRAPITNLLITVQGTVSEKVSLSDMQNLKVEIDCP